MKANLYYLAGTAFLLTGGIMILSDSDSILKTVYIFLGLAFMSKATAEKKKQMNENNRYSD
ncbi:hypothetical protein ACI2JA_10220 [Alkalihalobacillus sp. NPDC078783]